MPLFRRRYGRRSRYRASRRRGRVTRRSRYVRKKPRWTRHRRFTAIGRNRMLVRPTRGFLPYKFPSQAITKFSFSDVQNLDPTASAAAYKTYRLGSIWDPEYGLGGLSASPYTQMSSIYNAYSVLSARYRVSWVDKGSGLSYTMFSIIRPAVATISSASPAILEVDKEVRKRTIIPGIHTNQRAFSGLVRFKDWLPTFWSDRAASMGASPVDSDDIFLTIGCYPTDKTTDLIEMNMKVDIEYTVMLFYKPMATSAS